MSDFFVAEEIMHDASPQIRYYPTAMAKTRD